MSFVTKLWRNSRGGGTPLDAAVAVNITAIRHTVGSAIRKKFGKYGISAAPQTRLRATTTDSLGVNVVVVRGNTTITREVGSTLIGADNYTSNTASANVPRVTAMSRLGGGDVTFAPDLAGGTTEYLTLAYEVT